MLGINYTSKFRHDLDKAVKRNLPIELLNEVINSLREGNPLAPKYHDHQLHGGEYKGCRECHIRPDWLFIYRIDMGQVGADRDTYWNTF